MNTRTAALDRPGPVNLEKALRANERASLAVLTG
mgnify:CR=1 FL=1